LRILGIDPGLRITGYACVEVAPPTTSHGGLHQPRLIDAGVIRLRVGSSVQARLVELERDLIGLLETHAPDEVCVEKLYSHYQRPTTAIIMGHARGVVLLSAQRFGASVTELAATEVKKSLTGHGHATKRQVQESVMAQCRLAELPEPPDVADAIAVALCAARRVTAPVVCPPLPPGEGRVETKLTKSCIVERD
jgi:crossover junction endodeoxyribonuclease RuvC